MGEKNGKKKTNQKRQRFPAISLWIRWKFWVSAPPILPFHLIYFSIFLFFICNRDLQLLSFNLMLCFCVSRVGFSSASQGSWFLCVLFSGFVADSWILMDTNNWRPAQAEPAMDTADWRTQLPLDSRQRIVNKMWVLFVSWYRSFSPYSSLGTYWIVFSSSTCVFWECFLVAGNGIFGDESLGEGLWSCVAELTAWRLSVGPELSN